MDAKNGVNGSPEQPDSPELELPQSLVEALTHLACALLQNNQILMQLVEQNQVLMEAMARDPEDADAQTDMEGKPIRQQ